MLARTKKRPNEKTAEISLRGPRKSREAAVRAVEPLGFQDVSEVLPWRSVLPEPAPGQALKGARVKEGLTQRALADLSGLPQRHLSEHVLKLSKSRDYSTLRSGGLCRDLAAQRCYEETI